MVHWGPYWGLSGDDFEKYPHDSRDVPLLKGLDVLLPWASINLNRLNSNPPARDSPLTPVQDEKA